MINKNILDRIEALERKVGIEDFDKQDYTKWGTDKLIKILEERWTKLKKQMEPHIIAISSDNIIIENDNGVIYRFICNNTVISECFTKIISGKTIDEAYLIFKYFKDLCEKTTNVLIGINKTCE